MVTSPTPTSPGQPATTGQPAATQMAPTTVPAKTVPAKTIPGKTIKDRLIVALDLPDAAAALKCVEQLAIYRVTGGG